MRVLYFAWLRERIGAAAEDLAPPPGIVTVSGLIDWLGARSPGHAAAFADPALLRCAVDQEFVPLSAGFANADEIAFFPPVTGG